MRLDEVIKSFNCCVGGGSCSECNFHDKDIDDCKEYAMNVALGFLSELRDIKDSANLTRFINAAKTNYGVEIKITKKVRLEDLCKLANLIFMGEY